MIIVILDHTLGTGQSGRVKAMSNRGSNARQGSDGMAQQWPFQNKWLLLYMHDMHVKTRHYQQSAREIDRI